MSFDRLRTLATVERIARMDESACRQQLADAVANEATQRERVEAATCRQQRTDHALQALAGSGRLDIARLSLYSDVSNAIDLECRHEQQVLKEREELCETRGLELLDKTHYREGVAGRIGDATRAKRAVIDAHEAEARLEAWMLRMIRRAGRV